MLLKDLQTLATKLATGTLFHVEKAGKAYSVDYSALAKAIIEEYADSTVGGSKQSVQAAIGALNSRTFANVQEYTVTSTATVADFVKYCKTITPYRKMHFLRVSVQSGGQSVFGSSSFVAILSFSSANYGWILCLSDSKSSGGIRNICVNGSKAYVEAFANTETEVSLS